MGMVRHGTPTHAFDPSKVTAEELAEIREVERLAGELTALFDTLAKAGREHGPRRFAIAKTKIEEAVMWATMGIIAD